MRTKSGNFSEVPLAKYARLINHGPCVIVTSGDSTRANAAPAQWNMPVNDDPPVAGVALDGDNFTSELVQKTGEFVLNVPDESLLPAIKILGSRSGRDGDKIVPAGLTLEAGRRVATPHLAEALAFIECKVRQIVEVDGVRLVLGDVQYAAASPDHFVENRWVPGVKTLHHLGGLVFALTGDRRSP